MPRSITFYYGMSGTFKATTINTLINKGIYEKPIWSDIKPWKSLESLLGVNQDDRVYAMLHLYNLKREVNTAKNSIVVERGVTDMLYYYYKNNPQLDINLSMVKDVLLKEKEICKDFEIKKVILVQRDEDFIENVILKEPTRSKEFRDLKSYLEGQDMYLKFTTEYNDIDEIIDIFDAKEYIEKTLGIEYKLNK